MRTALALALAAAATSAGAASGAVDWQRRVVTCTGSGAANLRDSAGNPAVARIGAEKAARLDALRSCMETVKGVQITSGQTAGGAMKSDAALEGKVQGVVKGFQVVGKPRYFSDGGVEVDIEVPLDGVLSDALLPGPPAPAAPAPAAPAHDPAPSSAAPDAPTAVVVDARGLNVAPALAPRLLDEAGAEIYGPGALAPEARKAGGAAYAKDLEAAKRTLAPRLGDRPAVVKAVRAQGSDLVISNADAAKLAGRPFLAQGRVVILAD